MSKIEFSKMNDGYSQKEVDTYISMIEYEHVKAVELITAQKTRIAELENVISRLTIENSQLTEKSKNFDLETAKTQEEIESLKKQLEEEKSEKFDLETAKAQEEIESLKKQLEEEKNKKLPSDNVFESKENLGEAVLSFAQINEELVGDTSSPKEQEMYHSKSQIDQIVDAILSEGNNTEDTSTTPRFSL